MTSPMTLGLDVAKRTFDAALLSDDHHRHYRQFANTQAGFLQLAAWLRPHADHAIHAGLEATGTYGQALALFLHHKVVLPSLGLPCFVAHCTSGEK